MADQPKRQIVLVASDLAIQLIDSDTNTMVDAAKIVQVDDNGKINPEILPDDIGSGGYTETVYGS